MDAAYPVKRGNPLKRFAWKWAEALFGALGVMAAGALLTAVQAVYRTPKELHAAQAQLDTLAIQVAAMRVEFSDVSAATWTFVGLRCLEMSDSAFVESKLPCGKAFLKSGLTRRLSR